MTQHLSFDLWMTLIRSNPAFGTKRAQLIADMFEPEVRDVSRIEAEVKRFDCICDRFNEITGKKLPAAFMYRKVLQLLKPKAAAGQTDESAAESAAERLAEEANRLFCEYPPLPLNGNIHSTLQQLRAEGKTLSVSSNTGFVEGRVVRKALKTAGLHDYFSFLIFSDEIGASKPSAAFYGRVNERLNVPKSRTLHVGDNRKTDYEGARRFGFNALLITNPNYTIDDIRPNL
ncbi:MAG: HAD family hydrolase [Prevotellaceae bacterium]|jgi:putative hydrolase of the HAD superfamily|nr:HAD family hydrolase [Prevotellaceae bacterium]